MDKSRESSVPQEYMAYLSRNLNGGRLRDDLMFADLPDIFGTNVRFSDCILSDFLL